MIDLTFFAGRANYHDVVLDLRLPGADWEAQSLDSITRVVLDLGATEVDSDAQGGAFDWPVAVGEEQAVRIALGGVLGAGARRTGVLVVFTSQWPEGLVWDQVSISIL